MADGTPKSLWHCLNDLGVLDTVINRGIRDVHTPDALLEDARQEAQIEILQTPVNPDSSPGECVNCAKTITQRTALKYIRENVFTFRMTQTSFGRGEGYATIKVAPDLASVAFDIWHHTVEYESEQDGTRMNEHMTSRSRHVMERRIASMAFSSRRLVRAVRDGEPISSAAERANMSEESARRKIRKIVAELKKCDLQD